MWTALRIIDTVEGHLRAQGRPSRGTPEGTWAGGRCSYRAKDGTKCAIGCLISDDRYDPKMEGLSVQGLIEQFPDALPFKVSVAIPLLLLRRLQEIHDDPLAWDDTNPTNNNNWQIQLQHLRKVAEMQASFGCESSEHD